MSHIRSESHYPEIAVRNDAIEVMLPDLISSLLFDAFEANHKPARRMRSFDSNLDASHEQVLTYLGTYFPRSLAESFVIFDSLLSDKTFARKTATNERVSICSAGTGTGGDLIGLILALDKRLPGLLDIEVVSIEGNSEAHETMRRLLEAICPRLHSKVNLRLINHIFKPPAPFSDLDATLPKDPGSFNFIISSKMLNELDSAHVSKRPYYEFCEAFSEHLKPEGVMLVLDVTSPNGAEGQWTPKLLNGQVNEFLSDSGMFKTILPLLCNRFEDVCNCDCYTQNAIHATYRNVTYECSKICYRVIGLNDLAEELSGSPALWDCPTTKDNKEHCQEFRRLDRLRGISL